MARFAQIFVNAPLYEAYTYLYEEMDLKIGQIVEVPLGKKNVFGVVSNLNIEAPLINNKGKKIIYKKIIGICYEGFKISKLFQELFLWMTKYYHYPYGQICLDCIPDLKSPSKKIEIFMGEAKELPYDFNEEQSKIYYEMINNMIGFNQHLIHGVTGSGKSLIFLRLILKFIKEGKSVHYLLPEINLTPQFRIFLQQYLNCPIYLYHGGLSKNKKAKIFKTLNENQSPIVLLGVRSSTFVPINNLGLIIVDEEHDQSFKQNDRCPYNARDVAIKKAQLLDIPIVLGSATPSLENYFKFLGLKFNRFYYQLNKRVNNFSLPKVTLIDSSKKIVHDADSNIYKSYPNDIWPFQFETLEKIKTAFNKGNQVIIYANKLGFASFIYCNNCKYEFKNKDCGCDNNLKFFKSKNILACQYCEYKIPRPSKCPNCGNLKLINQGFGTEKILEILQKAYPDKSIERFDRDELTTNKKLNDVLERFRDNKINALVGTQMISKGHNFENVNLVVVLGADQMMSIPDFRGIEKAYQQITQVAGRAGRFQEEGEVLIQTSKPQSSLFEYINNLNLDLFYKNESYFREAASLPPYGFLAALYLNHSNLTLLLKQCEEVINFLNFINQKYNLENSILGPNPCVIEKRGKMISWYILIKNNNQQNLHSLLSLLTKNMNNLSKSIHLKIDVDPMQIF